MCNISTTCKLLLTVGRGQKKDKSKGKVRGSLEVVKASLYTCSMMRSFP